MPYGGILMSERTQWDQLLREGPRMQRLLDAADGDLYTEHLLFVRFGLGEPLRDAGVMARMAVLEGLPHLTVPTMVEVASRWDRDERDE